MTLWLIHPWYFLTNVGFHIAVRLSHWSVITWRKISNRVFLDIAALRMQVHVWSWCYGGSEGISAELPKSGAIFCPHMINSQVFLSALRIRRDFSQTLRNQAPYFAVIWYILKYLCLHLGSEGISAKRSEIRRHILQSYTKFSSICLHSGSEEISAKFSEIRRHILHIHGKFASFPVRIYCLILYLCSACWARDACCCYFYIVRIGNNIII
jgi:hypothetical protein